MNRKSFVYVLAIIFFMPLFSAAKTVKIEKSVLERILQHQNELEQKVEDLQLQLEGESPKTVEGATEPTAPPLTEDMEYLKDEVEYMSDRLDKAEKKSILDKMHISGEFRVRADWLDFDNMKGMDGAERDGRIEELWSSRLRLNLRSEVTENIVFNSRLRWLKYWGETNYDSDLVDRRYYMTPDQEGNLHVERAYIDWFIPDTPFSVTFGRLPATDGSPYGFKNRTTRKSTWAQATVSGEYDGIILNVEMEKWTGLEKSMFRIAHAKLIQNYQSYQGLKIDDSRVVICTFDTPYPGVEDSLLWFAAYRIYDFSPIKKLPGLSADDYPSDAGGMDCLGFHFQFDDIMDTGLGWFGAFNHMWLHPRSEGMVLAPGYEVGLFGDSLHGDLGKDRNAYNIYTGLRYTLPFEALNHPQIGFEYNYGSKYWYPIASFSQGETFSNKMGVTGHAFELYYTQPLVGKNMFLRIGGVYQKFDYYPPLYVFGSREGADAESDLSILNTYFLVDVRF